VPVAVALGANQGDAARTLRSTVAVLRHLLDSVRVAPLYRTRPHAPAPQPPYLNSAVVGVTRRRPEELLAALKLLELRAGRRAGARHEPRVLDLDLLLYGDRSSSAPELVLPHPGLRLRRFVLEPLAQLVPDLRVPPDGARVAELLAAVGQEGEVERIGWEA
jgi:2-amino-4-hydroxy-6-hydroxymethyldihydropteridine diphosphokinase